jgi:tetratricopeptide (TPR) repeat protein
MTIRLFIFTLLLATVNLFSRTSAMAASVLQRVNRGDEPTRVQLFLHFDRLPGFQLATDGRKIDVELLDTTSAPSLPAPAADERMIKMVTKEQPPKTIVSFYFRYPPQKVTTEGNKETSMLLIDVLLGNQLSATYPELTTKLQGVSVVKRTDSSSFNPLNNSLYASNWLSFFTKYESPVEIKPQPRLHLPPFPLASAIAPVLDNEQWLPAEVLELARDNKWGQACQLLRQEVTTQPEEPLKERLVLTYAEALIRAGEYRDPYFLLQRIMLRYPDTLLADLANFLLIYQQAVRGDFVNSFYELKGLTGKIGQATPFGGSFALLSAELALLAGRIKEAEQFLQLPALVEQETLAPTRLLRQTDLRYLNNEKAKSLTDYLDLASRSPLIDADPMSLAFLCDCLYAAKRYPEAVKRYMQLADLLNNQPDQALALFRQAMSQLHVPALAKKARLDLQQVQEAFPHSRGGALARLKQTDLDYAAKQLEPNEARAIYSAYAIHGDSIAIREEAGLKEALVNALSDEHETSVNQCMNLLRSFQSGSLRTETIALLLQQLPGVIRQLVKDERYIQALVLAKQNKKFFARGWLDTQLLYDLANAYDRLGMNAEAAQTYQYLFEVHNEADRENIYLPLLRSLFSAGQYIQVEEFADRYQLRYPKGRDLSAVYLLKAQALSRSGQIDKAIRLLSAPSSPRTPPLELLKGRLFFETKEWQKVIDTLEQPELRPLLAEQAMLLPLAESYYQAGHLDQAALLFRQLMAQEGGSEQAQFRLAQIEATRDNRSQALNLFKDLAEKGKDPLWTKLAREETAILEMRQR